MKSNTKSNSHTSSPHPDKDNKKWNIKICSQKEKNS